MSRWFLLLPLLSGLLLWASYHPVNAGIFGWVALAPLLVYAIREPKAWRLFLLAWLGGWLWNMLSLQWLGHTASVGPYLLAIYMGLYVAVFALVTRAISRKVPLAVSAPIVWIALEYVRAHLLTGFPWLLLAYTQHQLISFIQIADLLGPWLVSAVVMLANATVAQGVLLGLEKKVLMREPLFRYSIGAFSLIVTASVLYGWNRMGQELDEGPRVLVIQPNIPQEVKTTMAADPRVASAIFDKHRTMTTKAMADGQKRDLVIWPESVIYGGLYYHHGYQGFGGTIHDDMQLLSVEIGTPVLFGSEVAEIRNGEIESFSNSAVIMDGRKGIVYRFDKVHLVLFSEKIPEGVPFLEYFTKKYTGVPRLMSFKEGTKFNTFDVRGTRFGTAICFEAVFPEIARDYARNGAGALVNISNEGWFKDSSELDQMLAMNRFRAIESRLCVVRATNTGVSAVIEPTGKYAAIVRGKEVDGTLDANVRTWKGGSLYRVVGDLLGWAACAMAAAGLVWVWASRMLTARKGESIVAR